MRPNDETLQHENIQNCSFETIIYYYLFACLFVSLFFFIYFIFQVLRFQGMQYFDHLPPKQETNENAT